MPMAATVKLLKLRPKHRLIPNRKFTHFFSSSSSSFDSSSENNPEPPTSSPQPSQPNSRPSFSSYFSDIKFSLRNQPSQQQQQQEQRSQPARSRSFDSTRRTNVSLEEIRKNLAEFHGRSAPPPPSASPISFQEVYNRNVIHKGQGSNTDAVKKFSFDAIREGLDKLQSGNPGDNGAKMNRSISLSGFRQTLKLRPTDSSAKESTVLMAGSGKLPEAVFGKEMREKEGDDDDSRRTKFLRSYTHHELGKKLKLLRPEEKKEKNWFSLEELNKRLVKLREIDERESELLGRDVLTFKGLRDSLAKLRTDDKATKNPASRYDILSQLGGIPSYMLEPPKEHLVEKYFHPDNMSSAEKLKLELKRVRDEFKMSESDCGSARVQVAQLTTKIKHLNTVLHKKDKHSRKGLQGMLQKRRKLLKYLRRTDWDSYCIVLSKLGLRDYPDYKN